MKIQAWLILACRNKALNFLRGTIFKEPVGAPICFLQRSFPGLSNTFEASKMVDEQKAGIKCYANTAPGFSGILKERYADFIVNEVDSDGKVVHLTSLSAPEEVLNASVDEDQAPDEEPSCINVEKHIEAFRALTSESDANLLKGLLNNYVEGRKEECTPVVLAPDSDKAHRTDVHNFFKQRLPILLTDVVDGPDSKSKCVRVRVLTEKDTAGRNNRKRPCDFKGKRAKNKRTKPDDDGQGFDSRGADDWPSKNGKYLQFHLYKENKDTQEALTVVGKMLGLKARSFGIAGTKDKRAVTTQRVTVFKVQASKLAALNKKLYGIKVGDFSYVDKQLMLGQLSGNKFKLTLRGVAADNDDAIKEAASAFGKSGFINYFGLQRFGTSSVPTFVVGAALLRGEWENAVNLILQPRDGERQDVTQAREYYMETKDADGTLLRMPRQFVTERALLTGLRKTPGNFLQAINSIPRTMRMMYVHSYQSYLWNHAVSRRIELYGVNKVVEGDIVMCKGTETIPAPKTETLLEEDGCITEALDVDLEESSLVTQTDVQSDVKIVTAEDIASGKFSIEDVVLPMPGCRTLLPANDVASIYDELAKMDSLDLRSSSHNVKEFSFLHLPGTYRRIVQRIDDFEWRILKYEDNTRDLAETDWDRIKKQQKNTEVKPEEKEAVPKAEVPKEQNTSLQTALQLEFTLSTSCYATMAIRELLKISSSVAYHKALTEETNREEQNDS